MELELEPLLTLLELLELLLVLLPTLLEALELLLTLLELLGLVLLGRSYVLPDCTDLEVVLLAELEELERLDVAGATLLTDELLPDWVALRDAVAEVFRDDAVEVVLRDAVELTLRDAVELALRDAVELALRDEADDTSRLEAELTDLLGAEATVDELRLTVRLAVAAEREVERLRFLSHPLLLILRLETKLSTLLSIMYVGL